jgi:TonB family protein
MKKFSLASATVLFIGLTAFVHHGTNGKKWHKSDDTTDVGSTKDLNFEVHGNYKRVVKKETLNDAKYLYDFITGYPVNWIANYISVEISATSNGKAMKAMSTNDALSTVQKNILATADLGTEIVTNVKYKYKNSATDDMEDREAHISMTVIPETEAEYVGGNEKMKKYLQENVINKISETTAPKLQQGVVIFTVNEKGEIANAKISQSSGDIKTDKLMVKAITKMPRWKPAENSKHIKVKQDFEFSVDNGGGC